MIGKIAVLALAGLLGVGTTFVVLELTSNETPARAIQLQTDDTEGTLSRDDDPEVAPPEDEGDGDRTRGDDGTDGGRSRNAQTTNARGGTGGATTGGQAGDTTQPGAGGGGGGGGTFTGGGAGSASGGGSGSGG